MKALIDYIISWLCYERPEAAKRVAYTDDLQLLDRYDVLIQPNGCLGRELVVPDMQSAVVRQVAKGKYIVTTDIVYATFFFVSRAEELIHKERDIHGRFLARHSLLGQDERLLCPLLDEYAGVLLQCLGEPLPAPGFAHVYLTHDVDSITQYRSLRGTLGGFKRGEWRQVLRAWSDIRRDPHFTFPLLVEHDSRVTHAETVYFVKQTDGKGYDVPQYSLSGKDYKQLRQYVLDSGAKLGVHSSYYGCLPTRPISHLHRSHYLNNPLPTMRQLAEAGYTDDFSMGFADHAGFRLQTTRSVRWIDPERLRLTGLTLHPLTVMDTTLSAGNYMHLTEDEAFRLCRQLIAEVRRHHGEACLLWHNSNMDGTSYHQSLYPKVLNLLK